MPPYDIVLKCPLPCTSYGKNSASEFGTMGMRKRVRVYTDECLDKLTEGVVNITRVEVNGCFANFVTRLHTNLGWYLKDRGISLVV